MYLKIKQRQTQHLYYLRLSPRFQSLINISVKLAGPNVITIICQDSRLAATFWVDLYESISIQGGAIYLMDFQGTSKTQRNNRNPYLKPN